MSTSIFAGISVLNNVRYMITFMSCLSWQTSHVTSNVPQNDPRGKCPCQKFHIGIIPAHAYGSAPKTTWKHDMEQTICITGFLQGEPISVDSPYKGQVTRSFDILFALNFNKLFNKESSYLIFELTWVADDLRCFNSLRPSDAYMRW